MSRRTAGHAVEQEDFNRKESQDPMWIPAADRQQGNTSLVQNNNSSIIFPRRKAGQNKRPNSQAPVIVTLEVLQEVFDVPLWKACKSLGSELILGKCFWW